MLSTENLIFTIFSYLFMVKAYKLTLVIKKIEKSINLKGKIKSFLNLFKLFFFVFLIAHFMVRYSCIVMNQSCFQYRIAEYSLKYYETNFLSEVNSTNWFVSYIYSMYFILMTMTTIGYGDLVPQNPIEVCYTIFVMLVSSALFGYTLNAINQIFDEIKINSEKYQE